MKTIKLYTLLMVGILSISAVMAQDEIYNEKPKQIIVDSNQNDTLLTHKNDSTNADSIINNNSINNLDEYYTEEDYYEEQYEKQKDEVQIYTEENAPKKRRERRNRGGDVAVAVAEVALQVFFNAIFFFAIGN